MPRVGAGRATQAGDQYRSADLAHSSDPRNAPEREVEIQLGATDESHIIRTIEYWDIERRRYPQYEHVAVIIAEELTARFLNVVSLFNGFIPLVAIQVNAVEVADLVTLVFTRVLDQMLLGLEEDDTEEEPRDRAYWETRPHVYPMHWHATRRSTSKVSASPKCRQTTAEGLEPVTADRRSSERHGGTMHEVECLSGARGSVPSHEDLPRGAG